MNVLVIFSASEVGGAERSLTRMALAAVGSDINYCLATLGGHGPWVEWCNELGVYPLVFGDSYADSHHGFGIKEMLRLVGHVRGQRYSVLYVMGLRASLWLRLLRPVLSGAKLVHGIRWNPNSSSRLDRVFRLTERLLGNLVDLYICNSRAAAITLNSRVLIPHKKIHVVYNGIDSFPISSSQKKATFQRVLSIANLSPRKGYLEYLEKVVLPISKRWPLVRFVIVGRDDMSGVVQDKARSLCIHESIEFTGFLSDVSYQLQAADIFVLPSVRDEGCPTSILEAMSYNLPVVAFDIDGVPELIDKDTGGFLIPAGNYGNMKKSIENLLIDTMLSKRMGEANKNKVEKYFTIEHCAEKHSLIIKELLMKDKNNG